jgi:predicted alpha/beta hydrolase family esterase
MPHESEPDYQNWKTRIEKELVGLENRMILVGHSLGASFLLKCLSDEKVEKAIAGIFLIATPYWGGDGWRYEGYEAVALPKDFASKLPRRTPIFLYHGRDDEIVPFAHLALYARKLPQATIRALERRGHQLNDDLSEVAADIKSL